MNFQTPTPPLLDGAISYGNLFAVILVVGIFAVVIIGGIAIIITLLGGKQ